MSSTILIEDDLPLAETIIVACGALSLEVEHFTLLRAARAQLKDRAKWPKLILLDRGLPDGDGLELCRELRARGYRGGIMVLSAKGDELERVVGLDDGADDYLAKPFSWTEFSARARALLRRAGETKTEGPWTCNGDQLSILGARGWAQLTLHEFRLASHLISNPGTLVTRDQLLKEVWGFTLLPKTRTVDHFLGRIRKHLEPNPENPRHFVTIRGVGYRFDP